MKKLDKIGVMAASEGKKFKASYDGEAEEIEEYQEDEEVELSFPDPGSCFRFVCSRYFADVRAQFLATRRQLQWQYSDAEPSFIRVHS